MADLRDEPTSFAEVLLHAIVHRGHNVPGVRVTLADADAIVLSLPAEWRPDHLLKERDELRAALDELGPFADEIEAEYNRPSSRPQDAFDYRAVKGFIGWITDHRALLSKSEEQERG